MRQQILRHCARQDDSRVIRRSAGSRSSWPGPAHVAILPAGCRISVACGSHLIPPAPGDPRMLSRLVRRSALLTALALAYVSHPSMLRAQAATGTVRGHVTEGSGGRGIPEVQVTVAGTRVGALTNANGDFTLAAVPTGARTIGPRRIGYQPVTRAITVTAGDNDVGAIALNVSAVNLNEVVVT